MTEIKKKPALALHWKILIGMVVGIIVGMCAIQLGRNDIVTDWIKPFGTIFIKLLKLIAVPLILASLVKGVTSLQDITKLSRMGGKTLAIYVGTTVVAITVGLLAVNVVKPGKSFPLEIRQELNERYTDDVNKKVGAVEEVKKSGPLKFLEDMVGDNIYFFRVDKETGNVSIQMLQVIVFAVLLGISLILIPPKSAKPVIGFFNGLNDAILKFVDIIMLIAPIGVMALIAGVIVDIGGDDPFKALQVLKVLLFYTLTCIAGLLVLLFVEYPTMLYLFAKKTSPIRFFKAIAPAQMLAFSTSSSAATLPVTMERCEEHVGVSKEVSGFVLPLGATVNMDGTSLYQAVAAVFIAQAYGIDLTLADQLTIVLTATLASIGAAAVPGAGILMLIVVLNSVGLPPEGIALVMAPDRLVDMLRTVINVTGDSTVATIVASTEKQLHPPSDEESLANEAV